MVNNHGDRKSPKDRVVGPLPNGQTPWLINGGNLLLTSPVMILQVRFFPTKIHGVSQAAEKLLGSLPQGSSNFTFFPGSLQP